MKNWGLILGLLLFNGLQGADDSGWNSPFGKVEFPEGIEVFCSRISILMGSVTR